MLLVGGEGCIFFLPELMFQNQKQEKSHCKKEVPSKHKLYVHFDFCSEIKEINEKFPISRTFNILSLTGKKNQEN